MSSNDSKDGNTGAGSEKLKLVIPTIESLSLMRSSIHCRWEFVPKFSLMVDGKDTSSFLGELYYENAGIEIANAIKVRDYVFTLERQNKFGYQRTAAVMGLTLEQFMAKLPEPDSWVVCCFKGNQHFNFGHIISNALSDVERGKEFTNLVIARFFLPLFPDMLQRVLKENRGLSWDARTPVKETK